MVKHSLEDVQDRVVGTVRHVIHISDASIDSTWSDLKVTTPSQFTELTRILNKVLVAKVVADPEPVRILRLKQALNPGDVQAKSPLNELVRFVYDRHLENFPKE